MFSGNTALWLNAFNLICVSLLLSTFVLAGLWNYLQQRLSSFALEQRLRVLWGLACLPWLVAVGTLSLLLHTQFAWLHWHHWYSLSLWSWHGVLFVVLGTGILWQFGQLLRVVVRKRKLSRLLDFYALDQQEFRVIESPVVQAFTAGLLQPNCYLTQGLVSQLDAQEIQIVQQHERAHQRRYDPLQQWLFTTLLWVFPAYLRHNLQQQFALALEQRADQAVVATGVQPLQVAQTLLKVARLTQTQFIDPDIPQCGFTTGQLEARLKWLLAKPLSQHRHYELIWFFMLFVLGTVLGLDMGHHVVELFFLH